ncbi:MAG: flavin reductase family protein [Negativicutes bacterium]|nr:flavin reductase family protein [Negativicutes bacterium]
MQKYAIPAAAVLAPVPAVLISSGDAPENYNIAAASWTGTVCSKPPMTYVSFRPATLSQGILWRTREFVINLITEDQCETLDWCGRVSGREHNKWLEAGLTPMTAQKVRAPLIAECPVNIECKVTQVLELGSHFMYLAEIVAVNADERFQREGKLDLSNFNTIVNRGSTYVRLGEPLARMGFSLHKEK